MGWTTAMSWDSKLHSGLERSTWLKRYKYDEESQILTVEFNGGFVQQYGGVTKQEFSSFDSSSCKGLSVRSFFGREI